MGLTERLNLPYRRQAERLAAVLDDIDAYAAKGCNEPELQRYVGALLAKIATRFPTLADSDEQAAERMELEADTQEDHAHLMLHLSGKTPSVRDHHADQLEKQGAASFTLARRRRDLANRDRASRIVAQQRLGVTGAA